MNFRWIGANRREIAGRPVAWRAFAGLFVVVVFGLAIGPARGGAEDLVGNGALLQGLDKVTARITAIPAPIGDTVRFGTLEITVLRCLKRPPEETPESAALMTIRGARRGEAAALLFEGWMFASSPALNALEHPVYDVWVKDCLNASSPSLNGPR